VEHGVDAGVPCHVNAFPRDALGREIGGGPSGGREIQDGQPAGQQAIHLLRKRLREIARTQSCFHMAYRNAVVEGGQGRGQRGGRITLYQYAVRCLRLQDRFKRFQDTRGEQRKGSDRDASPTSWSGVIWKASST
jgi:hypothetical protein